MTEQGLHRKRQRPLNCRGAVLLLNTYVVSLTLLALSVIALQRTLTDLRSAQISRDIQQAFFLAEGGLDHALAVLRTNPDAQQNVTGSAPTGSYTYRTQILSVVLGENGIPETLRQIVSTGQPTGTSLTNTVTATIRTQERAGMIVANRRVIVQPGFAPMTIRGDIRSARGKAKTVKLNKRTFVDGDVVIGPPAPVTEGGYTNLYGPDDTTDGVYLKGTTNPRDRVSGEIRADPMGKSHPAVPPPVCDQEPLLIASGRRLHVRDGSPMDLTGPGDGRVVICVPYVEVEHRAKMIIHDPTVLYAVGVGSRSQSFFGSGDYNPLAFYNDGEVKVVDGLNVLPNHGLTVVVTDPPGEQLAGDLRLGKFEGAVFAPASKAVLELTTREDREGLTPERALGMIAVESIRVEGVDVDLRRQHPEQSQRPEPQPTPTIPLLSWSN